MKTYVMELILNFLAGKFKILRRFIKNYLHITLYKIPLNTMISKNNFKDLIIYVLIIGTFILAFFIIKPVLIAIIYGLLLAYITHPVYRFLLKKIKKESIAAFIVCLGFFIIITLFLIIIVSSLFNQAVDFYTALKNQDIATSIASAVPNFLIPKEMSASLVDNLKSTISNLIFSFLNKFNEFITDLPILFLKFAVTIFVFFFALRDGVKAMDYLKSVSPLKKETEEKFIKRFKDVTNSVLLGQIFVGMIQGLVAGIGYFVFGVDGALLLTLLSVIASIIPMVGPSIVWAPIFIYMLILGRSNVAFIFLIYNLFFTSLIDNIVRPLIISKRTEINSAIIIVGMIGGFLVLGVLGLIIGPLILAYVLLIMEIYRKRESESAVFKESEK